MVETINRLINWILAGGLIAAVTVLAWDDVYPFIRGLVISRRRLNFSRERKISSLELMLRAISGDRADAQRFRILSVVLGICTLGVLFAVSGRFDLWMLVLSVGLGLMPMLVQWARLQVRRAKGSYEGIDLVATLASSYIVAGKDITLSLDLTVANLRNCPYSKFALAQLAKAIKQYRTEAELREAHDAFMYAYRTEWASILSFCIFNAVIDGVDVSAALSSLIEQFQRATQVMERSKRYNREAFMVMLIMVPAAYLGLMFYGASMFGHSIWQVLEKQVTTPMGIKMLFVMLILTAVCGVLASIVTRPRYDL